MENPVRFGCFAFYNFFDKISLIDSIQPGGKTNMAPSADNAQCSKFGITIAYQHDTPICQLILTSVVAIESATSSATYILIKKVRLQFVHDIACIADSCCASNGLWSHEIPMNNHGIVQN